MREAWPWYRYDAANTGHAPENTGPPTDINQRWSFETNDRVRSSPIVANGDVVFGSEDGYLYALDATDGSQKWAKGIAEKIVSSPGVMGDIVYIGSHQGAIHALDLTSGSEQWQFNTNANGGVISSPVVVDGIVYVGSDDGNIYALDATDGSERWSVKTGGRVRSSPAVTNETIYVGSDDAHVYALDVRNGAKQWHFDTGDSGGMLSLPGITNSSVFSSPTVVDGTVYVGSDNGYIYALDASSGVKQWATKTGARVASSPVVVNDTLYIGSEDNKVYALDTSNGSGRWVFNTDGKVASSPVVVDGVVYVGSDDGNIYAIDVNHGNKQWKFRTENKVKSTPAVVGGIVYIGSDDGNIYAIGSTNNSDDQSINTNMGESKATGREAELQHSYRKLSDRNPKNPEHDPAAVERNLAQCQTAIENGQLDEAEEFLDEAERIAGPSVQYLLTQARKTSDEAQSFEEQHNLDEAMEAWETARDQYERAYQRAKELNDPMADSIKQTLSKVENRLQSARVNREESELQELLTDAWDAIRRGDALWEQTESNPAEIEDEYQEAIEAYENALDFIRGRNDLSVDDTDITNALNFLQKAQRDCTILNLYDDSERAIVELNNGEYTTATKKCSEILENLNDIERPPDSLRELTLRAGLTATLGRTREDIRDAESLFEEADYHEADDRLSKAQESLDSSRQFLRDTTDLDAQPEIERSLNKLRDCCEEHRDTIRRTLTDIDTDPSLNAIEDIQVPSKPEMSDVPSPQLMCQSLPVAPKIWQAVAADEYETYTVLRSLIASIHDSDIKRWIQTDQRQQLSEYETTLDSVEPIRSSEHLATLRTSLRSLCIDIIVTLINQLDESLSRLEEANLPDDFYDRPATIDESVVDALAKTDDFERFKTEWNNAIKQLTDALKPITDAVSTLESYDEVAELISQELTEVSSVRAADLPVKEANLFFELYAYRNSGVIHDPETDVLREG